LAHPRHADTALTVRVPAGGEAAYAPVLPYPFGVLSLSSDPPGARAEVRAAGATPWTTATPFHAELPTGAVSITLSAPGCLPATLDAIAIPGNHQLVERTVRLERDTGTLEVRTPRPGSQAR